MDGKRHGCHVRFDSGFNGAVELLELGSNGVSLQWGVGGVGLGSYCWRVGEPLIKVGLSDKKVR